MPAPPNSSGAYALILAADCHQELSIGKLGTLVVTEQSPAKSHDISISRSLLGHLQDSLSQGMVNDQMVYQADGPVYDSRLVPSDGEDYNSD